MRVAALYDVHGNLPALEAVLGADGDLTDWPAQILARRLEARDVT